MCVYSLLKIYISTTQLLHTGSFIKANKLQLALNCQNHSPVCWKSPLTATKTLSNVIMAFKARKQYLQLCKMTLKCFMTYLNKRVYYQQLLTLIISLLLILS